MVFDGETTNLLKSKLTIVYTKREIFGRLWWRFRRAMRGGMVRVINHTGVETFHETSLQTERNEPRQKMWRRDSSRLHKHHHCSLHESFRLTTDIDGIPSCLLKPVP